MCGNTVLELKRVGFGGEKHLLNICVWTLLLAKNPFVGDKWKQSKPGNLPNPTVPWVSFLGNRTQQEFANVSTEVKVFVFCTELNEDIG